MVNPPLIRLNRVNDQPKPKTTLETRCIDVNCVGYWRVLHTIYLSITYYHSFIRFTSFRPRLRLHGPGIKTTLYFNPGYKLSPCKISSKSVEQFKRDWVTNIHTSKLSHFNISRITNYKTLSRHYTAN
jgi:hypothetical protein